jgi:hypothetical protein
MALSRRVFIAYRSTPLPTTDSPDETLTFSDSQRPALLGQDKFLYEMQVAIPIQSASAILGNRVCGKKIEIDRNVRSLMTESGIYALLSSLPFSTTWGIFHDDMQ